jgi:hypothetical protein
MGMYDESWCNGCGTSVAYTDADETYCGECAAEYAEDSPQKLIKLIEYMKLHLISLEQDSDELQKEMDSIDDLDSDEYKDLEVDDISTNGQLFATRHLLSVASDILASSNERE